MDSSFSHKTIFFCYHFSRWPITKRLVGSLVFRMCLFLVTTFFVVVDTDSWQVYFFGINMGMAVLLTGKYSLRCIHFLCCILMAGMVRGIMR